MVGFSHEYNGPGDESFNELPAGRFFLLNRISKHWVSPDASDFFPVDVIHQSKKDKVVPRKELKGGLERNAGDQGQLISDEVKEKVLGKKNIAKEAIERSLGWMEDVGEIE